MTGSRMTFELPRDEHAPAVARAALGGFARSMDEKRFDATRLLVSELVTNAVKYGGNGSVRLEVERDPHRFRAEVIDSGSGFEVTERRGGEGGGGGGSPLGDPGDPRGALQGSPPRWFRVGLPESVRP